MPKPFPAEFRRDVVAVARRGEAPIARVAADFGISSSCLTRWLSIADRDDGLAGKVVPGAVPTPAQDAAELRELRKRTKLLEQEIEVLRRATAYFARDVLPK